ncbi:MAG: accessory Sec system protein Asp1 [Streptococcus sp.]
MEGLGENQIIDEESVQDAPDYRFVVKNFSNENDIIQELEKTRLIVDLSEEPNLYTQIAGISAGIPQVNRVQTEYVDHLKNGCVLSKGDKELEKAITHFLLELKPWNEALVYSIEKIQEYTGQRLIEKWEGWMKNVMDKKLQIPHILQIGSSSWQDQVELPAGLGWHFFQATALPSLKEYMEEEEISKFKALILEKPEDLLALGEDLAYFQPVYCFL